MRFTLQNSDIEYTVKPSPRARRVSISVHKNLDIIVTKPKRVSLESLHNIVQQNISIIEKLKAKASAVDTIDLGASQEDYKHYKKTAEELLAPRAQALADLMNIKYSKITVRYQSSRWGSCSSTGTISLNYKLAKLPIHLQDYVIIHELAHRKQMNHSSRFWDIVEEYDPQYKTHIKELKKYF